MSGSPSPSVSILISGSPSPSVSMLIPGFSGSTGGFDHQDRQDQPRWFPDRQDQPEASDRRRIIRDQPEASDHQDRQDQPVVSDLQVH